MNKLTLETVAILGVVITLSVALVLVPAISEVDARTSLKVKQEQSNKCKDNVVCTNSCTIIIG